MVTAEIIRFAIQNLGLSDTPVCLHSSLRSFGWVDGGAQTVVEAFQVKGCTLLVPSFTTDYDTAPPPEQRPERNGCDYTNLLRNANTLIYTPESKKIARDMGAVPAYLVNHPQRVRGNHPINSFSAIGPLAEELICDQAPLNAYAPLSKLVELSGVVVLAGVGYTSLTLLHLAEQLAGRTLFRRWANGADGQPMMVEVGSCSSGFKQFAPYLEPIARRTQVGDSEWIVLSAAEVLSVAVPLIKEKPEITHCGNTACERCRDAVAGGPVGV